MEDLAVKIAEVDQRGRANTHRIEGLEKKTTDLAELTTSVKLLAQSMAGMATEQTKQGERLTILERQPAERWNTMTRTILTTIVSTLAGGLVGALVAMLIK